MAHKLSPTGRVILGFVAVEPMSGYDIKAKVDKSTRFFWAASYGQIYPELKRLAEQGLIEPDEETDGGRRRTTYGITRAGRDALAGWIRDPELTHELRDEGLLKLFFAGLLGRDDAIAVIEAARERYTEKREALLAVEPVAAATERIGPNAVLEYGLGMTEFAIGWCDDNLRRLKENK
jgi:DNA-binding PadR family transcriptional regulator